NFWPGAANHFDLGGLGFCRRLLLGRLFGGSLGRSVLGLCRLWGFLHRGGVLWWCLSRGLRRRIWLGAWFRFSGFLRCRLEIRLVLLLGGLCLESGCRACCCNPGYIG